MATTSIKPAAIEKVLSDDHAALKESKVGPTYESKIKDNSKIAHSTSSWLKQAQSFVTVLDSSTRDHSPTIMAMFLGFVATIVIATVQNRNPAYFTTFSSMHITFIGAYISLGIAAVTSFARGYMLSEAVHIAAGHMYAINYWQGVWWALVLVAAISGIEWYDASIDSPTWYWMTWSFGVAAFLLNYVAIGLQIEHAPYQSAVLRKAEMKTRPSVAHDFSSHNGIYAYSHTPSNKYINATQVDESDDQ